MNDFDWNRDYYNKLSEIDRRELDTKIANGETELQRTYNLACEIKQDAEQIVIEQKKKIGKANRCLAKCQERATEMGFYNLFVEQ